MDLQYTFDFLNDLAVHNNKEWMDANKKRYNTAKQVIIDLVAEVIKKSTEFDPDLAQLDPRKTLFRINRDIRFSKNKDPYKTNFGASLTIGGSKTGRPGYYIHIKPEDNHVGGGIYQPSSEFLSKIRQEIDYNGAELRQIIEAKDFKAYYGEPYGDRLKTAPKGYPKDHEQISLLQLKHHVFMKKMGTKEALSDSFVDTIVRGFRLLYPYNQFLIQAMD